MIASNKSAKVEQTRYLQLRYKGLDKLVCEVLNTTLMNLNQMKNTATKEIIQAYINYFMMNRIFNALYNIMLAEDNDLSMFQEFQIFCLRFVLK